MSEHPTNDKLDLREKGRSETGEIIYSDRRLYMQLLAFGECKEVDPLVDALKNTSLQGTLYLDLNDPRGVALVVCHDDPDFFVNALRSFIRSSPFDSLPVKQDLTMFGRTYSIGYEKDLDEVLLHRPLRRICNPATPWAVWYPLRRKGSFERLPAEAHREILMEHSHLGARFSANGYGQDIRLACHGLDRNDNDFVIGLVGSKLHPLSAMVQTMRQTRQTSEFMDQMGPFFVGKALWQSALEPSAT